MGRIRESRFMPPAASFLCVMGFFAGGKERGSVVGWRKPEFVEEFSMKKYAMPILMLAVFETIAITLWLTKDNLFYLFNFSYIGCSIALGVFLFIRKYRYARRIVQLLVGFYMLVYLGLICQENMQIEGFWYYLFSGVFEAATIHYAVAKIFGPLIFGRGWCGYACWTAMVLDFLPYQTPARPRKKIGWIRYCTFSDVSKGRERSTDESRQGRTSLFFFSSRTVSFRL